MGQAELAAFLKRLATERRLSPHTVAAYEHDLRALLEFCEREQIAAFPALDSFAVRRFAAESHRRGLGARSVARRLSAVRTFLNYLIEIGVVKSNAGVHVQAPKAPRRLPATLDADQVASLLAISGDEPVTLRDRAMLELFYSSGLRLAELVGLNLGDVDAADRTVRVLGKGSKARVVPVGKQALAALKDWLAVRAELARAGELGAVRRPPRRAREPADRAEARQRMGQAAGRADGRAPAHAAALVRDPRARVEPQSARRAGDARPREPVDDADLHAPRFSASRERLRPGASARTQAAGRVSAATPRARLA